MKHKKGAIGFVVGIILAVFLVGVVAYITLHSTGASVTSILEPLKKLVGIETSKAEESITQNKLCTIKRAYWSPTNKAKAGDEINVVIEGSGNCDDKGVKLYIYTDKRYPQDIQELKFKDNKIIYKWNVQPKSTVSFFRGYYFTYNFGDFEGRSENLEVVS